MIIVGDTSALPPTVRGVQALHVVLQAPDRLQAFCSEIMEKHSLAQELYGYRGRQVLPDMFCESQ